MKHFINLVDDICYDNDDYGVWGAVLYDLENNKVCTHGYGHGMSLKQCLEKRCNDEVEITKDRSSVSQERLFDALVSDLHFAFSLAAVSRLNVPCEVTSGRKMKGKNLLLCNYSFKNKNYFNYSSTTEYATVYDPATNEICRSVNPAFVKVDMCSIIDFLKRNAREHITEQMLNSIIWLYAYRMSYASCDRDNYYSSLRRIFIPEGLKLIDVDLSTATDPYEAKRLERRNERYKEALEAQMVSIQRWVDDKLVNESEERKKEVFDRLLNRWKAKKGLI